MLNALEPQSIAGLSGWRYAYVASTGSTNNDLLKAAKAGINIDKFWLTAGEQLAGKGRRGRIWVSPQGNLHASTYLAAPAADKDLGFLPLVCAVALHRAISAALHETDSEIKIKWPNDILVDGAKCCGMLMEADWREGKANIIVGCGINIIAHPDDTPYPAMHLGELVQQLTAQAMFHYLAESFAQTLAEWDYGRGKASIRKYWLVHVRGLGQSIIVNLAKGPVEGVFEGINADGILMLRTASGQTHEISAGDVFFPR